MFFTFFWLYLDINVKTTDPFAEKVWGRRCAFRVEVKGMGLGIKGVWRPKGLSSTERDVSKLNVADVFDLDGLELQSLQRDISVQLAGKRRELKASLTKIDALTWEILGEVFEIN